MRTFGFLVLVCAVSFSATDAMGQRRRRKPTPTATSTKASSVLKAGREKIATQIKVLTHFLYLYGGVAKSAQSANASIRDPNVAAQNRQSLAKIVDSFDQVHDGLDKLEADFSTNSTLRPYYANVLGVAEIAYQAKTQAAANHLDQAGATLLKAVDQLTDALAAMR